jgi:hypothetical protein
MSREQTPAEKLLNERQLFVATQSKVIDRAIRVQVDNVPFPGVMPGEILVKATQRLCNDVSGEELTPYKIDRILEDIVIEDAWGSFYWDQSNKRHLKLNPPGWADRNKKMSPPPATGYTLGPMC